ncbi:MAG: mandelate racemase [Chloroflexota bacterium]|nr:mandelate racemase [Chloroflexota bacterium]
MVTRRHAAPIEQIEVSVYTIPTNGPEADGTFAWDSTTMVLVEASAGGLCGLGYTYADTATGLLIKDTLAALVRGRDAMDVPGCWEAMVHAIRNLGRPGISSMAIAAVDVALWDLKARLLDISMVDLLGAVRDAVPVYGSGGFTTYPIERLQAQLAGWVAEGIPRVKMKIGTDPNADLVRVRAAREAIGPDAALYVDANGAYSRKQALAFAEAFGEFGVVWFEEPVPADDLAGLRLMRDRAPGGMDIAIGEYGYDLWYFRRVLEAKAVDVLQADASRCAGITGFMRVSPLTESRQLALSAHCCPSLHVPPCCAVPLLSPMEYFYDHARIEHMLFDGALTPVDGALHPDRSRPGLGLEFKRADAARYAV